MRIRRHPARSRQRRGFGWVFFAQIFDRVLLLLIHPPSDREEQKAERIQRNQPFEAGLLYAAHKSLGVAEATCSERCEL
jgi:hypothetical protein